MQARLRTPDGQSLLTIRQNNQYIIGRDQVRAEQVLNLEDPFVSRRHCVITSGKEFLFEDAGSKNGSKINDRPVPAGEIVPLKDRDEICVGKTRLVFQIRKRPPSLRFGAGVEMDVLPEDGGCRVIVRSAQRGCRGYILKMMENNPDPALPVPAYYSTLDEDRFEYQIRGAASLKEHFHRDLPDNSCVDICEEILRKILGSENLLMDESGFLMGPDSVFVTKDHKVVLIYLPSPAASREGFLLGLQEVFSYLEERCPVPDRPILSSLVEQLRSGGGVWDCYKTLKSMRKRSPEKEGTEKKAREKKRKIPTKISPGSVLLILSFMVFLSIYWFMDLSTPNLCGAGLILAGINVLAAGLRNNEKTNNSIINKEKKQKYVNKFMGKA